MFYENLLFLKETLSIHQTTSNITNETNSNEEDNDDDPSYVPHSSDTTWVPKRSKKNKNDDVGKELIRTRYVHHVLW